MFLVYFLLLNSLYISCFMRKQAYPNLLGKSSLVLYPYPTQKSSLFKFIFQTSAQKHIPCTFAIASILNPNCDLRWVQTQKESLYNFHIIINIYPNTRRVLNVQIDVPSDYPWRKCLSNYNGKAATVECTLKE